MLAGALTCIWGCGAEHFNGAADAANPAPIGSGGADVAIEASGGAAGTDATGGAGGGPDSATGGTGTGGADAAAIDSAGDLPPPLDAGDAGAGEELARDAGVCPVGKGDLSNVGTGDFKIAFHVVTTQTGWTALLNQRSVCNYAVFWDIRQTATGTMRVETDNNTPASYQSVESTLKVNDGRPHDVVVTRAARVLTIRIDGQAAGQGASATSLGALPPLRVGVDACVSTSDPATFPFSGTTLSEVCVTR